MIVFADPLLSPAANIISDTVASTSLMQVVDMQEKLVLFKGHIELERKSIQRNKSKFDDDILPGKDKWY
jgi:hypothetical protein